MLQFRLASDAGVYLKAWAYHLRPVGPSWQHTPDDGIRLYAHITSAGANWQAFLAEFEDAMAREGVHRVDERELQQVVPTVSSVAPPVASRDESQLNARLAWYMLKDPMTNADTIDARINERSIEASYANLLTLLDAMALASAGGKRDELQRQIAKASDGAPEIFSIEIEDRRPRTAASAAPVLQRDGRTQFEYCSEPVSAVTADGLIRCNTTTQHEHLSVLRYTRAIEHGGTGWLLVTVRFEYDALLARLRGRPK